MKDRRRAGRESVAVDPRLRATRRSHVDARLRADARGRDGGVRQGLAAAVAAMRMRELRPLAGNETREDRAPAWRGTSASNCWAQVRHAGRDALLPARR